MIDTESGKMDGPPRESLARRLWSRIVLALENPDAKRRQVYEFLPAALEIQETPPSPLGRIIVWVIMAFFVLAVAWASFGSVDIVSVAHGKIIPSGRVKTIQPLEIGSVKVIHVREGESVTEGQPLITLDTTQTEADTTRLAIQFADAELEEFRMELFDELLSESEIDRDWQIEADAGLRRAAENSIVTMTTINHQTRLLAQQVFAYLARREALYNEKTRREAERERIEAGIARFEQTLPIISARAESHNSLYEGGMIAKSEYLQLEQLRIEEEQSLVAARAELRETDAALKEVASNIRMVAAEYRRDNLNALTATRQRILIFEQDLVKARQRGRQQVLYSPIDGTVQQLAIHTVGGVVTPAQELMSIVPKERALEVEAFVANMDIGFVEEGQEAAVKIDTFNFTKYGLISGTVIGLSNDAIQDDEMGLVYKARVLLDTDKIQVGNKLVNLSPGMSVSVEVKTGKRRLIEFFMSPLLRYKQESVRER